MINIEKARDAIRSGDAAFAVDARDAFRSINIILIEALNELEASRKASPMVALFDTAEERAELARIDAAWNAFDATRAYVAARALLDKVLAAIDAGWPVDVDGAALAAAVADGHEVEHLGALPPRAAEGYRAMTRAVLSHVGRAETRKPVAISDAIVDAAARQIHGVADGLIAWEEAVPRYRDGTRRQARAVLEYAASIGGVTAPATMARGAERLAALAADFEVDRRAAYNHVPGEVTPPPDDGRAERLTRYRESLLRGYAGNESDMGRLWAEHADHNVWPDFSAWLAGKAESIARAMLAAERSPDRAV